jgi:hypothetical protein
MDGDILKGERPSAPWKDVGKPEDLHSYRKAWLKKPSAAAR